MVDNTCPICGKGQMVEKTGPFRFELPTSIPGPALVIPVAEWEECSACGEVILSPMLDQAITEEIASRMSPKPGMYAAN